MYMHKYRTISWRLVPSNRLMYCFKKREAWFLSPNSHHSSSTRGSDFKIPSSIYFGILATFSYRRISLGKLGSGPFRTLQKCSIWVFISERLELGWTIIFQYKLIIGSWVNAGKQSSLKEELSMIIIPL